MHKELRVPARAKFNLTLDVLGRRPDGYHELASVMQSLELSDLLTIALTGEGTVVLADGPGVPQGSGNLVYVAVEALRAMVGFRQGVRVEMQKRIPAAAGLGGGSSDAAAAVCALNYLLELGLTVGQLLDFSRSIGSDVPFCVIGGTALARGRGERLTLLPAPPVLWLVLARPMLEVSTAGVYSAWDRSVGSKQLPSSGRMMGALAGGCREKVVAGLSNHFETLVLELYPQLSALKKKLLHWGAERVQLCGSGPTLAAVVPSEESAAALFGEVRGAGYEAWLTHTLV